MRVAILEDDTDQSDILSAWLEASQIESKVYVSGADMLRELKTDNFDVLVVDWELPDISGLEVVRAVRETQEWPVPILFLTQRDSEEDIVAGLQAGADDYMAKPAKQAEFVARLNALDRRSRQFRGQDVLVTEGFFKLDPQARKIWRGDELISVTDKDFDLALFLFRNIGRLLSRGYLLEEVWGLNQEVNTRTVDTHVSRIRKKLGISPEECGLQIKTIYQHGYRLERIEA